MSQDKANNEAASADLIARQVAGLTKERDRLQELIEAASADDTPITMSTYGSLEACEAEQARRAASANQSSTPVPREGGNTCDYTAAAEFMAEYSEIRGYDADGTGGVYTLTDHDKWIINNFVIELFEDVNSSSHIAHVARQESAPAHETIIREGDKLVCTACGTTGAADTGAADAAGVDTPEFRRLLCSVFHVKEILNAPQLPKFVAHIETVYGAQQREAGRLGLNEAVERAYQNGLTAGQNSARQPVSEGLTELDVAKLFKAAGLGFQWVGEPAKALTLGSMRLTEIARAFAAVPPAKAEGPTDSERDAERYRWLLANYARGDGYADIDAALNDGEPEKYLNPAIDAQILASQTKGESE